VTCHGVRTYSVFLSLSRLSFPAAGSHISYSHLTCELRVLRLIGGARPTNFFLFIFFRPFSTIVLVCFSPGLLFLFPGASFPPHPLCRVYLLPLVSNAGRISVDLIFLSFWSKAEVFRAIPIPLDPDCPTKMSGQANMVDVPLHELVEVFRSTTLS